MVDHEVSTEQTEPFEEDVSVACLKQQTEQLHLIFPEEAGIVLLILVLAS